MPWPRPARSQRQNPTQSPARQRRSSQRRPQRLESQGATCDRAALGAALPRRLLCRAGTSSRPLRLRPVCPSFRWDTTAHPVADRGRRWPAELRAGEQHVSGPLRCKVRSWKHGVASTGRPSLGERPETAAHGPRSSHVGRAARLSELARVVGRPADPSAVRSGDSFGLRRTTGRPSTSATGSAFAW